MKIWICIITIINNRYVKNVIHLLNKYLNMNCIYMRYGEHMHHNYMLAP